MRQNRPRNPKPRPGTLPTVSLGSTIHASQHQREPRTPSRRPLTFKNRKEWRHRIGHVYVKLQPLVNKPTSEIRKLTPDQLRAAVVGGADVAHHLINKLERYLALEPKRQA